MHKKFRKEFKILWGSKAIFNGFKETGIYGMYTANSRHYWLGIKYLINFRLSVYWGMDL